MALRRPLRQLRRPSIVMPPELSEQEREAMEQYLARNFPHLSDRNTARRGWLARASYGAEELDEREERDAARAEVERLQGELAEAKSKS